MHPFDPYKFGSIRLGPDGLVPLGQECLTTGSDSLRALNEATKVGTLLFVVGSIELAGRRVENSGVHPIGTRLYTGLYPKYQHLPGCRLYRHEQNLQPATDNWDRLGCRQILQ